MPEFHDHERKKTVRLQWDTPILRWLYERWNTKYFYCGLPGPAALDIKLWQPMIRRVVAFELERERTNRPRQNIEELSRNLTVMDMRHAVFCGSLEETILWREDEDGTKFELDEFVTLFNLDFCGRITERIETPKGKRCLRFEAIREILTIQRNLFRETGEGRFIILITAHDSFEVNAMGQFLARPDMPKAASQFAEKAASSRPLSSTGSAHNTDLLRLFVFSCLREYFHGQNVWSVFLPTVSYFGTSKSTRMMHLVAVCRMEKQESPLVIESQSLEEFLEMKVVRATDDTIKVEQDSIGLNASVANPTTLLETYLSQ